MNLYKKPLSSSQYCHTEEEAVTNIHKVFSAKKTLPHLFKGISYPCSGVCEHVLSNLHFLSAKIHIRLLLDRN